MMNDDVACPLFDEVPSQRLSLEVRDQIFFRIIQTCTMRSILDTVARPRFALHIRYGHYSLKILAVAISCGFTVAPAYLP